MSEAVFNVGEPDADGRLPVTLVCDCCYGWPLFTIAPEELPTLERWLRDGWSPQGAASKDADK